MKALFLASAAVATLVAAPAMAQDAVGSAGVAYVNSQVDFAGFEGEADGAVADVSAAMPFGSWTVTYGAALAYADSDLGDDTSLSGSAHLTKAFGDLRAGGFVTAADGGDDTFVTVGGEVQKYLSQATLTGRVSYGEVEDVDVWSVGGDAAFYPTANLRLNVGGSWNTAEIAGTDIDAYSVGAGAEYQLSNSPLSLFVAYDRTSLDDVDLDVDTVALGVRFNFGGDLQARDRAGANLARTVGGFAGAIAGL